jgi:hypothetical protein
MVIGTSDGKRRNRIIGVSVRPAAVLSRAPTMIQEIGFALDSPLEGSGFEL